jgi:TRAP transporter TAXI family solute receptor
VRRRRLLSLPLALAGGSAAALARAAPIAYKVVTASERGTYVRIGRDLARFVAPEADIALEVLPTAGSAENLQRLRYEPGVKLALMQSDVYQTFLDQAAGGNQEARAMIRPLRVVMPLYEEEICFVARADARLTFVHEMRGARINVGPLLSGTATSATTIYRQLFGAPIPEAQRSFFDNETALVKLTDDRSLDVVAVVAGQPARLLAEMKPGARRLVKLLKWDAAQPASAAALRGYAPATIRQSSYPNLLVEDVPALAVKALLVTYDYSLDGTVSHLARFARSLCRSFAGLRAEGHPKWREVGLALPAQPPGWAYWPPMAQPLRQCATARAAASAADVARASSLR